MSLSIKIVTDILKGESDLFIINNNEFEESYEFIIQVLYDNGYLDRHEYNLYLNEKVIKSFLLDILETSRPTS